MSYLSHDSTNGFDIAVKCLLKRRRGHVHSCSEFDEVHSDTALEQRSKCLSPIHVEAEATSLGGVVMRCHE